MKQNEPGRQRSEKQNPWQKVKHAWLEPHLLQVLISTFDSSEFSTEGALISESAVPHRRGFFVTEVAKDVKRISCTACGLALRRSFPSLDALCNL